MVSYVLPPAATPSLAVSGSPDRFAVRRIFCVGRNYADHAREMGHDPEKEPPFFFTKPADAIVPSGASIPYPSATTDLHHEAELVVALGSGGADLTVAQGMAAIWGVAAGNDLTRRDLQAEAKAARRPWDMSKAFDRSAIIGPLHRGSVSPDAAIRCTVDGVLRQEARLSDMIWSVGDIIAFLSRLVELHPGDVIMTGTPAGVGPLVRGQTCIVTVDGLEPASVTIV